MFDDRLKKLREARNLTQQDVAEALGITQKAYSNYETNERSPKDPQIIIKLCLFFGVTSDYLLGVNQKDRPVDDNTSTERSAIEKLLRECTDAELLDIRDYLKFLIWRRGER